MDTNREWQPPGFSLMDEKEREEFRALCAEYGFNAAEFVHDEDPEPMPAALGVHPLRGEVVVRRLLTGRHGRYRAGHGTAWVLAFEADLALGYFGAP
jgi:hypothetical protein